MTGSIVLASVVLAACVVPPPPLPQVYGAGSAIAGFEVDQWRADVARDGLSVNYQSLGSAVGRQDFAQGLTDFAVSELPFPAGESNAAARQPRYVPLVANGIGFIYNLVINGTPVTDLRLDPVTLAQIFSGEITNWDDPQITADNGRAFPSTPITPVVRSDGAATSFFLTEWFAQQAPTVYADLCKLSGLDPCAPTTIYPFFPGNIREALDEGVATYVGVPYNNGAIGYVFPQYAAEFGSPFVAVRNGAGNYVQPSASNVSVALLGAHTAADGGLDLSQVFNSLRPKAYPLSIYSLAFVPTALSDGFSTAKGDTLARFLDYAVCAGQVKSPLLGSASLPSNLVQEALTAIAAIPGAPTQPTLTACTAAQP
jgi:ABC-type phosphate transport system substrate-binding protein